MAGELDWLKAAGFKGEGLRNAWAIAKRESGFNPRAYNPDRATQDDSYGLFQINMLGSLGPARRRQYGLKSNDDLYDPLTNAKVAYRMSEGGTNWYHWGVDTGKGAYRKTAPLDFTGYPGEGAVSSTRQVAGRTGSTTPPRGGQTRVAQSAITMKDLNGLARQFGFKNIGQAFGINANQARQLTRSAVLVQTPRAVNPTGMAFKATPPAKGKGSGKGVAELFYDPAGKGQQWSPGWSNPIGGHSDHVHVSFNHPQTALKLIDLAQDMGLSVRENPYTENVDPVHTKGSFHYQNFPGLYNGKQLGKGIDVSGSPAQMMEFYRASRRYIG